MAPEFRLFHLGDRALLFRGDTQQLIELNQTAAALFAAVEGGAVLGDLIRLFSDSDDDETKAELDFVSNWLIDSTDSGLILGGLAQSGAGFHPAQMNIGRSKVEVLFEDAELAKSVGVTKEIDASNRSCGASRISVVREGNLLALLFEDGRIHLIKPERLITRLRHAIVTSILSKSGVPALHAACLVGKEGIILLCGEPGAGKSTLTLALQRMGWGFGSDDITFIDGAGKGLGLPLPLTLKRGSWDIVADKKSLEELDAHERDDGAVLKYLSLDQAEADWLPVLAIFWLQREDGREPDLVQRDKLDALAQLFNDAWSCTGKANSEDAQGMVSLVERAECFWLKYGEAEQAASLISDRYDVGA